MGRVNEQYYERPVIKEAITLEKSIDPTVGKILSENESHRVIELPEVEQFERIIGKRRMK